jgi:hypothetical protein
MMASTLIALVMNTPEGWRFILGQILTLIGSRVNAVVEKRIAPKHLNPKPGLTDMLRWEKWSRSTTMLTKRGNNSSRKSVTSQRTSASVGQTATAVGFGTWRVLGVCPTDCRNFWSQLQNRSLFLRGQRTLTGCGRKG